MHAGKQARSSGVFRLCDTEGPATWESEIGIACTCKLTSSISLQTMHNLSPVYVYKCHSQFQDYNSHCSFRDSPPAKDLIIVMNNMLLASEGKIGTVQMLSRLSCNLQACHRPQGMIQLTPMFLVATFDRSPSGGDPAMRSMHPLHLLRYEGQQIVSTMMLVFSAPVRHMRSRGEMRAYFAWMD